jgi:hypothetical protein
MKWPTTRKGWLGRWRHSLGVIRSKAADLWADREVYKAWQEIVVANPNLDKGNEFFHFLHRAYLSHILVGLRTFDDPDLRSHSLYNLIEEICDHNKLLNRKWFVARFPSEDEWIAHQQFARDWGKGPHIPKSRLQADLKGLRRTCSKVRQVVNKHLAHTARRKSSQSLMHRDIDKVLDDIYKVVSRYNALITNAEWGEPTLTPWMHVFDTPWSGRATSGDHS